MDFLKSVLFLFHLFFFLSYAEAENSHGYQAISNFANQMNSNDSLLMRKIVELLIDKNLPLATTTDQNNKPQYFISIVNSNDVKIEDYLKFEYEKKTCFINFATDSLFFYMVNFNLLQNWNFEAKKIAFTLTVFDFDNHLTITYNLVFNMNRNKIKIKNKEVKKSYDYFFPF